MKLKKALKQLEKIETENETMQHSTTYEAMKHLIGGGRLGFTTKNFKKKMEIQTPGDVPSTSTDHYHVIELKIISNLTSKESYEEYFAKDNPNWEKDYKAMLDKSYSLNLVSVYSQFSVGLGNPDKNAYEYGFREIILYLKENNVQLDFLNIDKDLEYKLNREFKNKFFMIAGEEYCGHDDISKIPFNIAYEANNIIYVGLEVSRGRIMRKLSEIKDLEVKE